MKPVHFLSAGTLSAVSHPLRQRILALLVEKGELSGRQIVRLVRGAPKNPYYHLDVLRKAGLVEVVREERRRGSTEKYYASVARTFSLDPAELVRGEERAAVRAGVLSVARNGAEGALEALAGSLEHDPAETGVPFVNLCALRLPRSRAAELRERLKAWVEDALAAACSDPDGEEDEECAKYVFYQLFFAAPEG